MYVGILILSISFTYQSLCGKGETEEAGQIKMSKLSKTLNNLCKFYSVVKKH